VISGLACLALVLPQFAGAQSSDYTGDDTSPDDDPVALAELFDSPAAPAMPADATLGMPAQLHDIAVAQSPTLSLAPATGVPARFVEVDNRFEVHADGSSTTISHVEIQLLSPQAVQALAQPALTYSDSLQTLEIRNAFTVKPDGTRLPVSPDAILVRQKAMPTPMFSDLKEKVILFPNVEPGDTLVYDSVIQSQAHVPGQFYFATSIPRAIEIDNETITFVTPKSLPLSFDSYGLSVQKSSEGDALTYRIRYTNRMPMPELPQFVSELDFGQRIFVSSAGSYGSIAAGYTAMVASKLAVTPHILAKANEITAGISDRREQARKLYEWVSAHVRYIALVFGDGGLVPRDAESVLTNGYGDCKDHAILYSALLRAKGIASQPTIINATNGYFLPQVPQLLTFNHMIVWLPEFGLYADTTSGTTPFGALPPQEYGKPVIRVGGGAEALQHTPVLPESGSSYASNSSLRLDPDGTLSVTHYATATGALSGVLRQAAIQANMSGTAAVAASILHARHMDSAAGSISFAPTGELTPEFSYTSNYRLSHALPGNAIFAMPEGLNLVDAASPALLGPVADARYPLSDPLPCSSGKLVDDYTLDFPRDRTLVTLPQDAQVQTSAIDYRSHWTLNGNTLSVHRELHAHFDRALCSAAALQATRAAIIAIRKDYATRIVLVAAHAS
jgi:transglutaminase-like putative cysteine protease